MSKKFSVILIIMTLLFATLIGHVFADTNDFVCKLHASVVPNNPMPGGDVVVTFSTTEINEKISRVSLALDYNKEIFDLSRILVGEGWNQTTLENKYLISTNDVDGTTQVGTIITFYLKVKETAVPGTETVISLTSIQARTNTDTVDFNDLKQTITISELTQEENKNETTGGDRNETTGGNRNETTGEDRNETTSGQRNETTEENKNEIINSTTRNETTTNEFPVQKVNQLENYTTKDKEPYIPQAGEDYGLIASIIGVSILSIVAFIIYRKNKM